MSRWSSLIVVFFIYIILFFFDMLAYPAEFPIGEPVERHEMQIAAIYIMPAVTQDDYWNGVPLKEGADIHLEADVHATRGNKNGFGIGEWIPYLTIHYTLKNLKTDEEQSGLLWQMVASDGPHYGQNIRLRPGNYRLIFTIDPPSKGGLARHTDDETGVAPWWDTFEVEWNFEFKGKGGKNQ